MKLNTEVEINDVTMLQELIEKFEFGKIRLNDIKIEFTSYVLRNETGAPLKKRELFNGKWVDKT
jgi:hypothetical protein